VSENGAHRSSCCDIDFHIDSHGDMNIYNCSAPSEPARLHRRPPSRRHPPSRVFPPIGACFPAVPGAKHKLSRDYKLAKLSKRVRVPSALAAGAMHMARRFLLGKTAANPLEVTAFATFARISRDTLSCTLAAFDRFRRVNAVASSQRP